MKLKIKLFLFGLIVTMPGISFAQFAGQNGNVDIVGAGGTGLAGYSGLHKGYVNSDKLTSYDDIDGSCFWDKDWKQAILFPKEGGKIKLTKARLNFYTNEIHFMNKDEELTLKKGVIKNIIFLDPKDTSKVIGYFKSFLNPIDNSQSFVEELNKGSVQLLKMTLITLRKMDYNQYRNESRYRFISKSKYLIENRGVIKEIDAINKDAILSAIPLNMESKNWLKSNKNNLKKEKEVIEFLSFYNSSNPQ